MATLTDSEAEQQTYDTPGSADSEPVRGLGSPNVATVEELKDRESSADDGEKYGPSAQDDMREAMGLNYTGGSDKKARGISRSRLRKRMAIAAAAAGAGAGGGVLIFMLMLPIKIESVVSMIEGRATAATEAALGKEQEHLYSRFIARHVMPSLGTPGCRRTIDPGCVVTVSGTGPVSKLYQAWSQNKLQYQMATKYGIIIGKENGKFTMSIDGRSVGNDAQFAKLQRGEISLADLDGKDVSRGDVRRAVNDALKKGTLWDRTYKRYQYGKLLETRFHIKRCVIACDLRDKFADTKEAKLLSGKLRVAQKVSGIMGESYGLILECVIDPNICDTKLQPTTDGTEPRSEFQTKLDEKLTAYIAAHGVEKLAVLTAKAKDIGDLGLDGYLTKEIAGKVGEILGGKAAGEVTQKTVAKAVPWVGWASFAIDAKQFVLNAPAYMKSLRYTTSAMTAASTFAMYQSAASEMKSGHVDLTELGSLADTLSADQDMTTHPIYSTYSGKTVASSGMGNLSSLLSSPVSALAPDAYSFKCDDGNPVPSGKLACPEEDFQNAGDLVNFANSAEQNQYVQSFLGFATITDPILNLINSAYKNLVGLVSAPVSWIETTACDGVPPCANIKQWATDHAGELFQWLTDHMMPNQWLKLSGGRMLAMSTAGAEVTYEKSAMLNLGAGALSDQAYLDIQNQYVADEQATFDHMSLFGRITNKDNPYSLVSRVAMGLPSPSRAGSSTVAGLFTNPFSRVGSAIGSLVPGPSAFAAPPTAASVSAFGVKHGGYTDSQIPSNPDQYWKDHCAGRDFVAEFMGEGNMVKDPDTGEATPKKDEPCMLIDTATSTSGAMFDASFIPKDAQTTGTTAAAGTSVDQAHLAEDSSGIACATGTKDLGIQDGYNDGSKVAIRVCGIPGLKSNSPESNGGITGADGNVMVNSRVSGAWLALFTAAKTSGLTLTAGDGFRSMAQQQAVWQEYKGNTARVAPPGYSPHQLGLAIDFAGPRGFNGEAQTCNSRVTDPSNPTWAWLDAHAAQYGFKQYSAEAWHWDPLQKTNRCGGGST